MSWEVKMGSYLEINDTLRINKKQGFPKDLDIKKHLRKPYNLKLIKNKFFSFSNKPNIRYYHQPPVRTFLVEEINGKWIYWGLCHILELTYDYQKKTTSGKYKIIYLNSPDEMKQVFDTTDRRQKLNYFENKK